VAIISWFPHFISLFTRRRPISPPQGENVEKVSFIFSPPFRRRIRGGDFLCAACDGLRKFKIQRPDPKILADPKILDISIKI